MLAVRDLRNNAPTMQLLLFIYILETGQFLQMFLLTAESMDHHYDRTSAWSLHTERHIRSKFTD